MLRFKLTSAFVFLFLNSLTRPRHSLSAVLHFVGLNVGAPNKPPNMPMVGAGGRTGGCAARNADAKDVTSIFNFSKPTRGVIKVVVFGS